MGILRVGLVHNGVLPSEQRPDMTFTIRSRAEHAPRKPYQGRVMNFMQEEGEPDTVRLRPPGSNRSRRRLARMIRVNGWDRHA